MVQPGRLARWYLDVIVLIAFLAQNMFSSFAIQFDDGFFPFQKRFLWRDYVSIYNYILQHSSLRVHLIVLLSGRFQSLLTISSVDCCRLFLSCIRSATYLFTFDDVLGLLLSMDSKTFEKGRTARSLVLKFIKTFCIKRRQSTNPILFLYLYLSFHWFSPFPSIDSLLKHFYFVLLCFTTARFIHSQSNIVIVWKQKSWPWLQKYVVTK